MTKSFISILVILLFYSCSKPIANLQPTQNGSYFIKDFGFEITLPESWIHSEVTRNGSVTDYNFVRKGIKDNTGLLVSPFIGIMCEKVTKDLNVLFYSMAKRAQFVPWNLETVLTAESKDFPLVYGIGYIGTYNDANNLEHKIIILHMINDTNGIQIIIDGTTSIYEIMKNEYLSIISSIVLK